MKKNILIFFFLTLGLFLQVSLYAQTVQVIYVKKGATGFSNGTSWADAYPDLQQALNAYSPNSNDKEFWVSAGEYKPTTIDRTQSFILPANTKLYGGFNGTESTIQERNWKKNRTLLSGDIGLSFDDSDNSYHVIIADGVNQSSILDGFIIVGGNANGESINNYNSGGGMAIFSTGGESTPTVTNCLFEENKASNYGGGISIISTSFDINAHVIACEFNGNESKIGGAIAITNISASNSSEISNCKFSCNKALQYGGALANIDSDATIFASNFCKNQALIDGGAIYNFNGSPRLNDNILWKNFKGQYGSAPIYNQILNQSSAVIQHNIVQGGFGIDEDDNDDLDPLFVREPSFEGKFPRTTIIPVSSTDLKYEKIMSIAGPLMPTSQSYYAYKDLSYNKIYIVGKNVQILDFNHLSPNSWPESTLLTDFFWGRIQRLNKSISNNKIYFATTRKGILSIDRENGVSSIIDPLVDESVTYTQCKVEDIVVDKVNNLLYAVIFYWPDNKFYGLLEFNLTTNEKKWINMTSMPISIPLVSDNGDDSYWNGHRLHLDTSSNTLYFSTGHGVWWWNKEDSSSGVFDTSGGIPLVNGNPNLPSNLTTAMFIDNSENKFYIGTHNGLFVWDRNNNTSRVYNTENSLLVHDLINHIDKNEVSHEIYVSCEFGGILTINSETGEQKLLRKDEGNEVNPQLVDTNCESVYYDEIDNKLYVSTDKPNGGVWVRDYNSLMPDYGDLSIKNKQCHDVQVSFNFSSINTTFLFTPAIDSLDDNCNTAFYWSFGDGVTSNDVNPEHTFTAVGTYTVSLKVTYECSGCSISEKTFAQTIVIEQGLCETIYCSANGSVAIGSPISARDYRLSVNGKLLVTGMNITLGRAWPDYVFNPAYKLTSLSDLKRFVYRHKHLPEVPTAREVKRDGLDVEQMSAVLLQKTEELTLYFIQLDERLKKLESDLIMNVRNKP